MVNLANRDQILPTPNESRVGSRLVTDKLVLDAEFATRKPDDAEKTSAEQS
jgi:hypothetical protein